MRYLLSVCLLVAILVVPSPLPAADPSEAATNALHAALAKNIDHAKEWLEQKDYKSLVQSAGGLQWLAELLKTRGDGPAWQGSVEHILSATASVQSAAREEDVAKCKVAIDSLQKAAASAAALKPTGNPQSIARTPQIRSLMLTMDAIQGDAKVAALTGDADAAKKQAHVLAELGKLVASSRNTNQWSSLAGDFVSAATTAASSSDTDPKIVRQHLRGVAQKCEACHEQNRSRQ